MLSCWYEILFGFTLLGLYILTLHFLFIKLKPWTVYSSASFLGLASYYVVVNLRQRHLSVTKKLCRNFFRCEHAK